MNFKNQYLTYSEYRELSGTLKQVPFNLLEYDVRKKVNERTQNRLVNLNVIPLDIKICMFKMINILQKYSAFEEHDKAIASENTDGYSISYRKLEASDIEVKEKELEDIMRSYLSNVVVDNVPVLYLGVAKC